MGTDKSSTFGVDMEDPEIMLTFGSVAARIASDVAKVGELSVNMTDGILLMTQDLLLMEGNFEGILGLGAPNATDDATIDDDSSEQNSAAAYEDMIKQIIGSMGGEEGDEDGGFDIDEFGD